VFFINPRIKLYQTVEYNLNNSDCIFNVTKYYFFLALLNTATGRLSDLRPYSTAAVLAKYTAKIVYCKNVEPSLDLYR